MVMKNKKENKEILVIFASFSWFAQVLEANRDNGSVTPDLMSLYRKLAGLCMCNQEDLSKRVSKINTVVKSTNFSKSVDYLLLSITIIAEYYLQMRGKKRLYSPMTHSQIIELQDEALEGMPTQLWRDTFDYAEFIVNGLLSK